MTLLHCALSCGAVYCNRPCLCVCVFVCVSVTTITRNCVHRSSPYCHLSVGEGSDHLQLIKFWPSRAPGKGSTAGRNFLAPPYYSQRAVFASPSSAFSFFFLRHAQRSDPLTDFDAYSKCAESHRDMPFGG